MFFLLITFLIEVLHCVLKTKVKHENFVENNTVFGKTFLIFAGSLESANSSILASCDHFKEVGGEKNQGFMIIRFFNPSDLIGCGGDN